MFTDFVLETDNEEIEDHTYITSGNINLRNDKFAQDSSHNEVFSSSIKVKPVPSSVNKNTNLNMIKQQMSATSLGYTFLKPNQIKFAKKGNQSVLNSTLKEFNMTKQQLTEESKNEQPSIDHIESNKALAKNINQYKIRIYQFKSSDLNKASSKNLAEIKISLQNEQDKKRTLIKEKMKKWDNFKEKRNIVVSNYIKALKKSK